MLSICDKNRFFSKHETLNEFRIIVVPASQTMRQHETNIGLGVVFAGLHMAKTGLCCHLVSSSNGIKTFIGYNYVFPGM